MNGKVCVVTGGASGIGSAIVQALVAQGAQVVSLDIAQSSNAAGNLENIQCDVTDRNRIRQVIDHTANKYGRIDVLVACAGIHNTFPFLELPDAEFDRMINVNLTGVYNTIKPVLSIMKEQNKGRIITFTSIAGVIGSLTGAAHYAAAKGGVIALTKSLAREFGAYGITVNTIAPGIIDTPMIAHFRDKAEAAYVKNAPVGRIGLPQDITGLVLFLASDESSYITGQVINISGGYVM